MKNKDGVYSLDDVTTPTNDEVKKNGMQDVKFNNININQFNRETIKEIIKTWLNQVENVLKSYRSDVYNQKKLIKVFYRYIQWSLVIDNDFRHNLSGMVVNYLKNNKVSTDDKDYLKKINLKVKCGA